MAVMLESEAFEGGNSPSASFIKVEGAFVERTGGSQELLIRERVFEYNLARKSQKILKEAPTDDLDFEFCQFTVF
jgi:hypothetical protein